MDGSTPDRVSLAELEAQITELAGHLNAANYRWLTSNPKRIYVDAHCPGIDCIGM